MYIGTCVSVVSHAPDAANANGLSQPVRHLDAVECVPTYVSRWHRMVSAGRFGALEESRTRDHFIPQESGLSTSPMYICTYLMYVHVPTPYLMARVSQVATGQLTPWRITYIVDNFEGIRLHCSGYRNPRLRSSRRPVMRWIFHVYDQVGLASPRRLRIG